MEHRTGRGVPQVLAGELSLPVALHEARDRRLRLGAAGLAGTVAVVDEPTGATQREYPLGAAP